MLSMYRSLPVDVLGYRVIHIREISALPDESVSVEPLRPAEEDHEEHKAIVEAFEARDPSRAEEAIRAHLERAMQHQLHLSAALGRA
jgi:DNA-binding GntR family transcriptional regulator